MRQTIVWYIGAHQNVLVSILPSLYVAVRIVRQVSTTQFVALAVFYTRSFDLSDHTALHSFVLSRVVPRWMIWNLELAGIRRGRSSICLDAA